MRQDPSKRPPRRPLRVKKETVRALDARALGPDELAQVAGGTYIPRQTCRCSS